MKPPLHLLLAPLLLFTMTTLGQNSPSEYYITERLPDWFIEAKILDGLTLQGAYQFDTRLNPLYLEADFNGDKHIDVAIPIKKMSSGKVGFAIIHSKTNQVFIIGAGTHIPNGISDNMGYIDIWKVNRKSVNQPGVDESTGTGEKGELMLKNPSLQIEKSEIGGGQIYWDGKQYAYFHQTC